MVPQASLLPLITGTTLHYSPPSIGKEPPASESEPSDSVPPQPENEPIVDDEPAQLRVKAVGADGAPFGVGMLEMPIAKALELGWYHDQAIELKASDSLIWLPVCQRVRLDPLAPVEKPVVSKDRLNIYFLYSNAFPANIDMAIAGQSKLKVSMERHDTHSQEHANLLQQWWSTLCQQSYRDIPSALAAPTNDLLLSLGLRLGLTAERPAIQSVDQTSAFEKQFERILGMLLGFESVRLAMMIDDTQATVGHDPAIYPLPQPLDIRGIALPPNQNNTSISIEPIAHLVPDNCFYVRCGSIQNYMWLRQFLKSWGGSLDEIVSSPSLDTNIRGHLEAQLGINPQHSANLGIDKYVSDLAIVGTDVFFEEGAGIGILLQASIGHEQDLQNSVEQQRSLIANQLNAQRHSETLQGYSISILQTTDHRMRSFLVRLDRYILITNSRELLNSVLQIRNGGGSLADLSEYRYALGTTSMAQGSGITFYLSDPFFRRITSPAFRIELNRRRESAGDCRRLSMALLLARSMGETVTSKTSLVDSHFLPIDFGLRPDGSSVELINDEAVDTLRGHVGTFVPTIDIAPTHANQNELNDYSSFTERYRREWPAMDPVLVLIKSIPGREGLEQVDVQIHVTPYARSEYAFLTSSLAEPTRTYISLTDGELLGVSTALISISGSYIAHLGLFDSPVPFRIEHSELLREGPNASSHLAQQRSFAAVSPPGTDGLKLLAAFMNSIQTRDPNMLPPARTETNSKTATNSNSVAIVNGLLLSPLTTVMKLSEIMLNDTLKISQLGALYEDAQWSIYGATSELRQAIRLRLVVRDMPQPAQIYMQASGIDGSDMSTYLNAYSYCASRRQSAACAAWLNLWTVGLHLEPRTFTQSFERAMNGRLKCSLGGQWILQEDLQWAPHWTSTKWQEPSLASVNGVPKDYRFPFLEWLKAVQLKFNLAKTTLSSHVRLQVAQGMDSQSQPITLHTVARPDTRPASVPKGYDSPQPIGGLQQNGR